MSFLLGHRTSTPTRRAAGAIGALAASSLPILAPAPSALAISALPGSAALQPETSDPRSAASDPSAEAPRNQVSEPERARPSDPTPSRLHLTAGTDVVSAYYFRGIRQEDSGLIVQPYADFSLDVRRTDSATISFKLGTWNSLHGQATSAGTDDDATEHWYEADVYAGAGAVIGKWTLDARYTWYLSPSDAFGTVEEVSFGVAFDDSEHLGRWSLRPSATLAIETGPHAADGSRNGAYLQLGIAPGLTLSAGRIESIAVAFPAQVGLSLSNYYEGSDEENDTFGYASVGIRATVPIPIGHSWGHWSFYGAAQGLFLGDAARSFNDGDSAELIGSVGVSVSF